MPCAHPSTRASPPFTRLGFPIPPLRRRRVLCCLAAPLAAAQRRYGPPPRCDSERAHVDGPAASPPTPREGRVAGAGPVRLDTATAPKERRGRQTWRCRAFCVDAVSSFKSPPRRWHSSGSSLPFSHCLPFPPSPVPSRGAPQRVPRVSHRRASTRRPSSTHTTGHHSHILYNSIQLPPSPRPLNGERGPHEPSPQHSAGAAQRALAR